MNMYEISKSQSNRNTSLKSEVEHMFEIFTIYRHRVTTFQTTWNSPTFPVQASNDYPVSSVYRYGQQSCFILMKNSYLTVAVVTAGGRGWGVPLPSRLEVRGSIVGGAPAKKTSFGVFKAEKTHLISLPWLFPDHFAIPRLFQVFQVSSH